MRTKDEIIPALRRFKETNQNKYGIIRIGIFGSACRDSMNEQSDIDVVVELEKQDLFSLIGIKQDLEEQFRLPVDVVSYRRKMGRFLKQRIDHEAVYV
jgi:predicted nucleotidyltransferase